MQVEAGPPSGAGRVAELDKARKQASPPFAGGSRPTIWWRQSDRVDEAGKQASPPFGRWRQAHHLVEAV